MISVIVITKIVLCKHFVISTNIRWWLLLLCSLSQQQKKIQLVERILRRVFYFSNFTEIVKWVLQATYFRNHMANKNKRRKNSKFFDYDMLLYYTVRIYPSNYINILKRLQQKYEFLQCLFLFNDFFTKIKMKCTIWFKANISSHSRSYVQLKHIILLCWSFFSQKYKI